MVRIPKISVAGFLRASGEVLFSCWTQNPICTKAATEAGFGVELSLGNVVGHIFHLGPGFLKLGLVAARQNRSILTQVVEGELVRTVPPLLACSQRIDGKLQALIGVFLRERFAGFVGIFRPLGGGPAGSGSEPEAQASASG